MAAPRTDVSPTLVADLYAQGMSIRRIAQKLYISASAIGKRLKNAGVCGRATARSDSGFNHLYSTYRASAIRRGLEFSLSKEEFKVLTSATCHYCGRCPEKQTSHGTSPYIWNGVDRRDNTTGYVPQNCVPCCAVCNYAKGTLSYADFMEWVARLIAHQTDGRER